MMFLKVCGITRLDDGLVAVDAGATALGFVFWQHSPRAVTPDAAAGIIAALPAAVAKVGVFVNESVEGIDAIARRAGLTAIQLHGDEPPDYARALRQPIFRAVTVASAKDANRVWPADTTFLLDAADREKRGGTGRVVDWHQAADTARLRPLVLAGGLTPGNVADAIAAVQPFGVDVSSGVEQAPGIKDPEQVTAFLTNARRALEQRGVS